MKSSERAEQYAAIFLNVGDRWRGYAPLDATLDGEGLYIGGVRMVPRGSDEWVLAENGVEWVVRRVKPPCVCSRCQVSAPVSVGEHAFKLAEERLDDGWYRWRWECGCSGRGVWQYQSDSVAYHAWRRHAGIRAGS